MPKPLPQEVVTNLEQSAPELFNPAQVDPAQVSSLLGGLGLGEVVAEGLGSPPRTPGNDPNRAPDSITPENQSNYESLFQTQLESALKAHDVLSGLLHNASPTTPERATAELHAWLTNDKLDYVRQQIERDPELSFTLVATPNVLVNNPAELFDAAKAFGKNGSGSPQPHETWIYDEKLKKSFYDTYPISELSGTNPDSGKAIQFSLVPCKAHPELASKTTDQQRNALANDLQPAMPDLRVPSVLEALAYWQTLREKLPPGEALKDFDTTYIRHFDLEDKTVGAWLVVPASYVYVDGEPLLNRSRADRGVDGRLLVG